MTRKEAICEVFRMFDLVDQEWGRAEPIAKEAIGVLTAMGVSQAEIDARDDPLLERPPVQWVYRLEDTSTPIYGPDMPAIVEAGSRHALKEIMKKYES